MRYNYTTYRFGPGFGGGRMTPAVKGLLIACGVVFLLQIFIGRWMVVHFGLTPALVVGEFKVWQLGTYLFLHDTRSIFHIFFNMFMLWMFGCELERYWGRNEFLKYYFITGIGAGFFQFFSDWMIPTIGASGAIYGLLLAYGLLFPDRRVLFFFIIPMKMKHVVIVCAVLVFLGTYGRSPDGIAHFAHMGGMVVGYLYLKRFSQIARLARDLKWRFKRRRIKVMNDDDGGRNDLWH